jgi:hypothetical protein
MSNGRLSVAFSHSVPTVFLMRRLRRRSPLRRHVLRVLGHDVTHASCPVKRLADRSHSQRFQESIGCRRAHQVLRRYRCSIRARHRWRSVPNDVRLQRMVSTASKHQAIVRRCVGRLVAAFCTYLVLEQPVTPSRSTPWLRLMRMHANGALACHKLCMECAHPCLFGCEVARLLKWRQVIDSSACAVRSSQLTRRLLANAVSTSWHSRSLGTLML